MDACLFQNSTESTLGGGGTSSCTLSEMLVLATVLVHETRLANQHFMVCFWGEGEYSLYACENAKNCVWSLTTVILYLYMQLRKLHIAIYM